MRTIRFVEGMTSWPFSRQSPGNDRVFNQSQFFFGPGVDAANWLVVLNDIPMGWKPIFPRERTIFLAGEPASVRTFHPRYLAQFWAVVTTDPTVQHPRLMLRQPFLPWHVGIRTKEPGSHARALTFAQLTEGPPKSKLCSCICSDKTFTPGHQARLDFVTGLRRVLGSRIDYYGRGFQEIADKEEALAPYRYHVVLENSVIPHYWTEKLADCYLRNCFPIYSGAPNVANYFDPASLVEIDITRPDIAVARIRDVLDSDLDRQSADLISAAKRQVLWQYNMLAQIDRLVTEAEASGGSAAEPREILPEAAFLPPKPKLPQRIARRVRRLLLPQS